MRELTGVSQVCCAGSVQMDAVLGCCRPRGPDWVRVSAPCIVLEMLSNQMVWMQVC